MLSTVTHVGEYLDVLAEQCFKVAANENTGQTLHLFIHMETFLQIAFTEMERRDGRRDDAEAQLTKHSHMGRLLSGALYRCL